MLSGGYTNATKNDAKNGIKKDTKNGTKYPHNMKSAADNTPACWGCCNRAFRFGGIFGAIFGIIFGGKKSASNINIK